MIFFLLISDATEGIDTFLGDFIKPLPLPLIIMTVVISSLAYTLTVHEFLEGVKNLSILTTAYVSLLCHSGH